MQTGTRTRYAHTVIALDGLRTLAHTNQGRNHWDTAEQAQQALDDMCANNDRAKMEQLWPLYETLAVSPIACFAHGDAIGIYPENEQLEPWSTQEARQYCNTAAQCLFRHDHSWQWCGHTRAERRDDENLTRANCGACVLKGYHDRDDDEHNPHDGPNYAGWARVYVESGVAIPRKWRAAFARELMRTDNPGYSLALRRSMMTFGPVRFAP